MSGREPQLFVSGCRVSDRRGALPTRAGAEPYETRALSAITMAVIHYSGVDSDSSAEAIAAWQTSKTEGDLFPEIAYHFVVRQGGEIEQCHDLMTRSWHAGSEGNTRGVAICLPMLSGPTEAQLSSTAALLQALNRRLGRVLQLKGHKELYPSACPGPAWEQWRKRLLAPSPLLQRGTVVNGVPVKWAFYDWYKRLEGWREGLSGAPLAPHRQEADGSSRQEFVACSMRWRDGEMWLRFKSTGRG